LHGKNVDEELINHIEWTFYRFVITKSSLEAVIRGSEARKKAK
jgi:hypothetical protein